MREDFITVRGTLVRTRGTPELDEVGREASYRSLTFIPDEVVYTYRKDKVGSYRLRKSFFRSFFVKK